MRLLKVLPLVGGLAVLALLTVAPGEPAVAASWPDTGASAVNWPQFRGGARHTGMNPFETTLAVGNVAQLGVKWQVRVPLAVSSPVVADGVVYVGAQADHSVYALDE